MPQKFEIQYFGNVNYYSGLINSNNYAFSLYEPYRKMGFLNRCRILGANGPIDLTVPVVGGREVKLPVKDVRISYREDWRSQHYRSLVSAYNRSPWFFQYQEILEKIYTNKFEYLWELNFETHRMVSSILKIDYAKNSIESIPVQDDGLPEIRYTPKDPNPLRIQLPEYVQVFSDRYGFVPSLSILDLIFCEGPGALRLLKTADKQA